jgi:hypothetical protein
LRRHHRGSTDGDVVHLVFRGERGSLRFRLFRAPRGLRISCMSDPTLHGVAPGARRETSGDCRLGAYTHGTGGVVRATPPHREVPPAGGRIRSKSRLPGRLLLPSSTSRRVAAAWPSRTFDRFARRYVLSVVRDPPDLGADFPDAFRSLRPDHPFSRTAPGFLSWGCPKIAPPSSAAGESASRRAPCVSAEPVRRVTAPPVPPS